MFSDEVTEQVMLEIFSVIFFPSFSRMSLYEKSVVGFDFLIIKPSNASSMLYGS